MPYLVVTERYAIQIESDRKAAVLHDNPEVVTCFGNMFDKMYQQSRPLMTSVDGFGGRQAKWGENFLETADFSHTMEMCSGLCSVQFWDERLIRRYMNRNIPGYEAMVEDYIAYTAALYQAKRRGNITVLIIHLLWRNSFKPAFSASILLFSLPNLCHRRTGGI